VDWWLFDLVARRGGLVAGSPQPRALWAVPLAYVPFPFVFGNVVGVAATQKRAWAVAVTGKRRAPRAWDSFFSAGTGEFAMNKSGYHIARGSGMLIRWEKSNTSSSTRLIGT
jgi:hypothetical protein